ncbi:L,D-transpeptidase [Streptomyces sp. NPDC052164]|uniref:L,D-transpeptidase n=1 Tax=unclassified Streptomyces TaxID=2593676 RepID=UPI003446F971
MRSADTSGRTGGPSAGGDRAAAVRGRGVRAGLRGGAVRRRIAVLAVVGAGLTAALPGTAAAAAGAEACTAATGPYQRPMEEYLERTVDGAQSPEDCAAIRTFQRSRSITPADGYANLVTYRTMTAVKAGADPNAAGDCPQRSYRVTCVDLDRQLLWVQTGKNVVFDPVPIRTGRDDEETRTGWHAVYWRDRDHVSTIYNNAPMPYSQFFDGGQALHGRPDGLFDGGGSAGCVNLRLADAAALWDLLDIDDALYIWGTKPGTAD